ncbi:MAG: hypothetical protein JNJ47_06615 [Alphaproteobacteria bacterium]|nr:hypothetical protein [Alphaproteobacteria bacterium]
MTLNVSPYEKKSLEPTWQHPYALSELPYPEFLKPYRSPTVSTMNEESRKNKPSRKNRPSGKNKPIKVKHSPLLTSSSSGYIPPSIEFSPSEPLADLLLSPEIPEEAPLLVTEDTSIALPLISTDDEPVSSILEEQGRDDSTTASSSTALLEECRLEITQPAESQTSERAPIRPRGIRLLHSEAPETTSPNHFVSLKGKHQKILDRLFDVTRFSSVRYQDFAALWRSINGLDSIKNASSGGSHKALLDQNGKVVTGIFAHGEAQTFGKRTIKYIRDAFHQIGYGPTR